MDSNSPSRLSGIGRRFFHLIEFDDNEELIVEIRKHPFGLALIYTAGFLIAAVILSITLFLSTYGDVLDAVASLDFDTGIFAGAVLALGGLLTIMCVIATLINGMIYRNSVIFVTSEKLAQVLYITIFNRKISQLNIGNIQDVTVNQAGVLSRIFHYGTLVVETAGEQQNYTFTFVPSPYQYSKAIIGAHERYVAQYGN